MGLTSEQIMELLGPPKKPPPTKLDRLGLPPVNEQIGPLRWKEKSVRCTSKRCGSPTFLTVNGVPKCDIHALIALNQMLVDEHLLEPDHNCDIHGHVLQGAGTYCIMCETVLSETEVTENTADSDQERTAA